MNQLLFTVGIFMFMLTVYGTIVIGGHLLKTMQEEEEEEEVLDVSPGQASPRRESSPGREPTPARERTDAVDSLVG